MVNKVLELESKGATLRLCADENEWCQVELIQNSLLRALGAESWKVVVERLMRGVSDQLEGPKSGSIDGIDVVWVLSLAELHCSIYAANIGDERWLFFQDKDGKQFARVRLSRNERQNWYSRLVLAL